MENANVLKAPGYDIVNLNVHYRKELNWGPVKSLLAYFQIENVFDETYISAANNITDKATDPANTTGSIYAGAPRTYYGGMKLGF
jgi:iron complex outermembrane recepter protein